MASSFYSNTQNIDFASVLSMNDPGMVSMFQAQIASGLEGFLGCTAVVYETALVDFFENASVRDGEIISTVAGQLVEISEEWSIVSMSGEQVILSGLKSQMKIHYRLLCDIMAKSISVKAGSFNAITVEKFSLMTAVVCSVKMNWGRVMFGILKKMVTSGTKQAKGFAIQISLLLENVPNLELGESSEFPSSKILTEKTVHRYIAVIDKSGAQDADVAPKATKAPKKRIAAVPADVPVVKRKRTTKKKDSSSKDNLELMAVAQDAVPIKMIEGSTAPAANDTADQPAAVDEFPADRPAEEIESVERVDEQLAAEPAVHVPAEEPEVEVSRVNVDDPETVIRQVLDQLDFVTEDPVVAKVDRVETWFDRVFDAELATADLENHDAGTIDCGDQSVDKTNEVPWFVRPFILADRDTKKLFETASDSENAMDLEVESQDLPVVRDTDVGTVGEKTMTAFGEQLMVGEKTMTAFWEQLMGTNDESSEDTEAEAVEKSADEEMSIDDIFMSIPAEVRLPSTGVEITKIIFGKEIKIPGVNEKTCFLTTLPQIPADDKGKKLLIEKDPVKGNPVEEQSPVFALRVSQFCSVFIDYSVFSWLPSVDITDFLSSIALERTALRHVQRSFASSVASHIQLLDEQYASSSSSDEPMHFDKDDIPLIDTADIQTSLPVGRTEFVEAVDDLRAFLLQRVDDSNSAILLKLHTLERGLRDTLLDQDANVRKLINSVCQYAHTLSDVQKMHLNNVKKAVLGQGVTAGTDSLEIRRAINALDAKILLLDGQVAAIRSEQLDFQDKIAADLLSLSTQIGDLVDYIRGGDAKKGEGSSSRPQPPPSAVQNLESGQSISLEETAERIREADRRQAEMERERERQRRIRRLSGSSKRRRGY
ncbi:dystroglycan-like [Dorcoceras hygrometricum]|uniref:Dystroglycan-like n=1 Tax=Dorcoceras hygrometricum TaxID=472368 RepID=A0A2Z7D1C0_9LAMI|nr:dystroglycan-like [Dorcoceras hygrometricum]